MTRTKVCHLSSVHQTKDVRIFHKECVSLAQAGYDVSLVVPGEMDHIDKGVSILVVPPSRSRRERLLVTSRQVLNRAIAVDADLYHFHDPELFPVGLWLKFKGKKVIFDSHEDLPRQLLSKPWIPNRLRQPLSLLSESVEHFGGRRLDAVIGATPLIRDRFAAVGARAEVIHNYPILEELDVGPVEWSSRAREVLYVGGITRIRGALEMTEATAHCDAQWVIAGPVEEAIRGQLEAAQSSTFKLAGYLNRTQVVAALRRAMVGLCVLHPTINYIDSMPIKLFEYMAAGIPVVASDFPLWRQLVGDSGAAIFVDPLDPKAIGEAIQSLLDDPGRAEQMGAAGKARVMNGFHWGIERERLVRLYNDLLAT